MHLVAKRRSTHANGGMSTAPAPPTVTLVEPLVYCMGNGQTGGKLYAGGGGGGGGGCGVFYCVSSECKAKKVRSVPNHNNNNNLWLTGPENKYQRAPTNLHDVEIDCRGWSHVAEAIGFLQHAVRIVKAATTSGLQAHLLALVDGLAAAGAGHVVVAAVGFVVDPPVDLRSIGCEGGQGRRKRRGCAAVSCQRDDSAKARERRAPALHLHDEINQLVAAHVLQLSLAVHGNRALRRKVGMKRKKKKKKEKRRGYTMEARAEDVKTAKRETPACGGFGRARWER